MMSLMNYPICKKWNTERKRWRGVCFFTAMICSCLLGINEVQAEEGKGLLQEDSSTNIWGGDDRIELRQIESGYEITLDGNGLADYYQYSVINFNFSGMGKFSENGGMSLYVENTGGQELYLNFRLNDISQNQLVLRENGIALSGRDRVLTMENNWIVLEPGYSGTIVIPFSECEAVNEQGEKTDNFRYGGCYGMSVATLVTQEVESSFQLSNVEVEDAKNIPELSESNGIVLNGTSRIKMPLLGEYQEQYELVGDNAKNYEFVETYYGNYIYMDRDGVLHINSGCAPGRIMLRMRNRESNLVIEKEITIYEDWRASSELYTFYSPTEVGKVTYQMEFLNREKYVKIVRVVCIVIVVGALGVYVFGRYRKRRDLLKLQKGDI